MGDAAGQLPVADKGLCGQPIEFDASFGQGCSRAMDEGEGAEQEGIGGQAADAGVAFHGSHDVVNFSLGVLGLGLGRQVWGLEAFDGMAPAL